MLFLATRHCRVDGLKSPWFIVLFKNYWRIKLITGKLASYSTNPEIPEAMILQYLGDLIFHAGEGFDNYQ
jgi:hypothetical protein